MTSIGEICLWICFATSIGICTQRASVKAYKYINNLHSDLNASLSPSEIKLNGNKPIMQDGAAVYKQIQYSEELKIEIINLFRTAISIEISNSNQLIHIYKGDDYDSKLQLIKDKAMIDIKVHHLLLEY